MQSSLGDEEKYQFSVGSQSFENNSAYGDIGERNNDSPAAIDAQGASAGIGAEDFESKTQYTDDVTKDDNSAIESLQEDGNKIENPDEMEFGMNNYGEDDRVDDINEEKNIQDTQDVNSCNELNQQIEVSRLPTDDTGDVEVKVSSMNNTPQDLESCNESDQKIEVSRLPTDDTGDVEVKVSSTKRLSI